MSRRAVWTLSTLVPPEAEEAVSELLEHTFHEPVVSYTHLETQRTFVTVYLAQKPGCFAEVRKTVGRALSRIGGSGLRLRRPRLTLKRLRHEDWAESWKRHFRALVIGPRLLIKPSWSRRKARKGQVTVVLDPGLSFGTGQHPTTAFCLAQIATRAPSQAATQAAEARRSPGALAPSLLDIGTGSGILAIAAAKLGYKPVVAFDFDPESVRVARSNAAKNGVQGKIRLARRDVGRLPLQSNRKFSVVCANLLSTLLLDQRDRITERVHQDGVLVLAGILKTEFRQVQEAYEAKGWVLQSSRAEREWRSGSFVWGRQ